LLRYLLLRIQPADGGHFARDFAAISFAKARHGAALRAAWHADDLDFRDFMNFFALADRTTGIIE
jgi:hypothetical protein